MFALNKRVELISDFEDKLSSGEMPQEPRQFQECVLCRNHGQHNPKLKHRNCQYEGEHYSENGEICGKCEHSKRKRKFIADEIQRKRIVDKRLAGVEDPKIDGKIRKSQKCRKCRFHIKSVVKISKEHKKLCPYNDCDCPVCKDIDLLREAMRNDNNKNRKRKQENHNIITNDADSSYGSISHQSASEDYEFIPEIITNEILDINIDHLKYDDEFNTDSFKSTLKY